MPWPTYPMIFRVSSAHEEGGERVFAVNTERFVGDDGGRSAALMIHEVQSVDGRFEKVAGTERELPAELVLLAMGFVGPREGLLDDLGRRARRPRQRGPGRDLTPQRCRASSSPATWAAASR